MPASPSSRYCILLAAPMILVASCYELPTVDPGSSTSSASGSSGMGGSSNNSSQSSSSSGEGGTGLSPAGSGGLGGASITASSSSASSSSSSSGAMGAGSVVENCGNVDCNTSAPDVVCCLSKIGDMGTCQMANGSCSGMNVYTLKCDDRADCSAAEYCCLNTIKNRTDCGASCLDEIVCKSNFDCPGGNVCSIISGILRVCGPP